METSKLWLIGIILFLFQIYIGCASLPNEEIELSSPLIHKRATLASISSDYENYSEQNSRPATPIIRYRDYAYPTPTIEYPEFKDTSTPRNFWRNYEFKERRQWNINRRIYSSEAYRRKFIYNGGRRNCRRF